MSVIDVMFAVASRSLPLLVNPRFTHSPTRHIVLLLREHWKTVINYLVNIIANAYPSSDCPCLDDVRTTRKIRRHVAGITPMIFSQAKSFLQLVENSCYKKKAKNQVEINFVVYLGMNRVD